MGLSPPLAKELACSQSSRYFLHYICISRKVTSTLSVVRCIHSNDCSLDRLFYNKIFFLVLFPWDFKVYCKFTFLCLWNLSCRNICSSLIAYSTSLFSSQPLNCFCLLKLLSKECSCAVQRVLRQCQKRENCILFAESATFGKPYFPGVKK